VKYALSGLAVMWAEPTMCNLVVIKNAYENTISNRKKSRGDGKGCSKNFGEFAVELIKHF
jgi:hypothetical protein